MDNLFLIRYGEIGTKGHNRYKFEDQLIDNIETALKELGAQPKINKTFGRIFIETKLAEDDVLERLAKVFGIVGICPVEKVPLDFEIIKKQALELVKEELVHSQEPISFRVTTNRSNKSFELDTMEVNQQLGSYLLQNTSDGALEVSLKNAELDVTVEIRAHHAYIYITEQKGLGGLPIGTSDQAALMLSGGIDSPVAGWLAMKRGVEIMPIYFHTPPFTSERAKEKVIDLAKKLALYQPHIKLHVVNFTAIQTEINQHCPPDLITLIMRRQMIKVAEKVMNEQQGGKALITGESIGQVASQTLDSITVTNAIAEVPIFRPLIGFDKTEIITKARQIGTYELSTKPAQDCCTVFVPDTPETHPRLWQVKQGEKELEIEELIATAVAEVEIIDLDKS
ncbi:MAG: tRNA uracil 4-sulfurtransferase ThiI [Bacillota bacterium]